MAANERTSKGETKQFLVKCDECSLSYETESRNEARRIGTDHHRETGHEVIAVEWPNR